MVQLLVKSEVLLKLQVIFGKHAIEKTRNRYLLQEPIEL